MTTTVNTTPGTNIDQPTTARPSEDNWPLPGGFEYQAPQFGTLAPAPLPEGLPSFSSRRGGSRGITAVKNMSVQLDAPLSELVEKRDAANITELFRDLVGYGVSDVHITKSEIDSTLTVEARVDGDMQTVHVYKGREAQAVRNTIKTGAGLSTGPQLIPEDGTFDLTIDGYPYRARAGAMPTFDGGERIVLRLPQVGDLRSIDELGFSDDNLAAAKALLDIPGGMLIIAGPTGEGKSTTALSCIKHLKDSAAGVILTLEDPVERVLPGIAQIEVREEVEGAGFGDMTRSINRLDPNVIFVGEIRDRATASAAIELAKSGRRVIATFHAKDNIGALIRLIKMSGDDAVSVLDSVNGVISQRLVPRLSEDRESFTGRYPIHEVTQITEDLTDALVASKSRTAIRDAAARSTVSFKTNLEMLVDAGITTRQAGRKVIGDA